MPKIVDKMRKAILSKIRLSVATQHADVWLAAPALFRVFVSGAVVQPGYVVVNGFTRVSDALQRAGGAAPGARRDAMSRWTYEHDGRPITPPCRDNLLDWMLTENEAEARWIAQLAARNREALSRWMSETIESALKSSVGV